MAGANKINQIETGDISEVNEIDSSTIVGISGIEASFLTVPIGLILPFNDTSIPAGWERFTSADNRHIVGAGNTYSPGDGGGSTTVDINVDSSSAGSHTGSAFQTRNASGFGYAAPPGWFSSGAHVHTIANGTYTPLSNNIILIKSTEDVAELPENSILLSYGGMDTTNLTNVLNNSRYLRGNSSIGTTGSNTMSTSAGSAGSHAHFAIKSLDNVPGSNFLTYDPGGGGSHGGGGVSLSVSESIKRVRLSAWSHASQIIEARSNMIGMYEDTVAPDGWVLCDGNNGSPDLRDYFINTVNGGSESSGSGNNTINLSGSGSLNHTASHHHKVTVSGVWNITLANVGQHDTNSWSHGHSYSVNTSKSYLPPYYALSFIMKAA